MLTGFSGLAYEVAWQRYLATLLGAHSEATAAVLGIFLGGLSLGYSLFGSLTRRLVRHAHATGRPPPLLAVYGGVEAAIGVYALLFPWLFRGAQQISLALPTGGGLVAFGADVALAAALIGPPAVLMGGTIPILTQALARSLEDATHLHALVYALNTVGAFAGALAAGFALVPWLGLDGVAHAMGAINLAAGATFVLLGRRRREIVPLEAASAARAGPPVYGAAALLVGFAMMTCQAVVIRIGGLTFGSSEFTFAMVVAAFVLSIAIGSLAVSAFPAVGRAALPAVLWGLVLAFGLLYTRADEAPHWGHVLRTFFTSQPQTFHVFFAGAFLATLAVIGPAAALSGAVLPLIFDAQRDEVGDLGRVAGRIYSQNTIGSLLGALIGGYALLFWLDLHHVFRIALCALALAAALITAHRYSTGRLAAAILFGAVVLLVLSLPAWDASQLSSGLFRLREPNANTFRGPGHEHRPVAFSDDDPSSTVAVIRLNDSASIVVNGKSDGNTKVDLHTMALAALLPALIADDAQRAFVIGFGTGITAGYLAELDTMREVTVAEISAGVLAAAPMFDFANQGASHHPKIERVRSDAYRALLRSDGRYDVIVSEPSNPWAAGIEMLFSREFLRAARAHLAPGGVYVQWFHLYENNDESVQLVLQNFAEAFEHVAVWRSQATDVLLLGITGDGAVDLDRIEQRMKRPDLRAGLARVGIDELSGLLVHEALAVGVLHAEPRPELAVHSLFHPRLSYVAGRGFFVGEETDLPFFGSGAAGQVGRRASLLRRYLARYPAEIPEAEWSAMIGRACLVKLPHCPNLIAAWAAQRGDQKAVQARIAELRKQRNQHMRFDLVPLLRFFYADHSANYSGGAPDEVEKHTRTYLSRYYHAFPFAAEPLVALWRGCRQQEGFGPRCQRGLEQAQRWAGTGYLASDWLEGAVR